MLWSESLDNLNCSMSNDFQPRFLSYDANIRMCSVCILNFSMLKVIHSYAWSPPLLDYIGGVFLVFRGIDIETWIYFGAFQRTICIQSTFFILAVCLLTQWIAIPFLVTQLWGSFTPFLWWSTDEGYFEVIGCQRHRHRLGARARAELFHCSSPWTEVDPLRLSKALLCVVCVQILWNHFPASAMYFANPNILPHGVYVFTRATEYEGPWCECVIHAIPHF